VSVTSDLRTLTRMTSPYLTDECEMGDGCPNPPAFWLTAEASYVKPMILCAEHAEEEHVGYGTPIPPAPSVEWLASVRDAEMGFRLGEVEQMVRNQVGPILSSGRSGHRAWLVLPNDRMQIKAVVVVKRAGFTCRGAEWSTRIIVDLASLDVDIERLRCEDALDRAMEGGPVYRLIPPSSPDFGRRGD
jgi:hypothetical protein